MANSDNVRPTLKLATNNEQAIMFVPSGCPRYMCVYIIMRLIAPRRDPGVAGLLNLNAMQSRSEVVADQLPPQ